MTSRTISATTTVQAPPATVFAILADPRQHSRIDGSGSVGSVIEAPERLTAKGQTFSVRMRIVVPYKITNRVVEYDPDRRIAWRHFGGHRWRYELEPTGDGTGTTVTETFDYSRYNTAAAKVLELTGALRRNRHGIEQTLVRLKQAAEGDAAS
ncbi:MAG TPA: SRPBCC family protein [Nocardioidaceae bacterium]